MIVLVDIGNTNICFGLVKDDQIVKDFRIRSFTDKYSDEYYVIIKEFINDKVDAVMISSVVPVVTSAINKMFIEHYNVTPLIMGNNVKTGIKILTDDPKTVGSDLLCDVAAACNVYEKGLIIDLGTASKFIYYNNKSFISVSIAPGMSTSMKELVKSTALLPNFELVAPKKVLNTSTIPCMQSGVIFGFASLVDGMISRIKEELNEPDLKLIGTGGLFKFVSQFCKSKIDLIDPRLTLKGVYEVYKKNI